MFLKEMHTRQKSFEYIFPGIEHVILGVHYDFNNLPQPQLIRKP